MLQLSDLDHLRGDKRVRFKTEIVGDRTFTIVCYMIADTDYWKLENSLETRGITFDEDGNCVCRPLEKFFNLNENEWTQANQFNFEHPSMIITEKIDGSMVTPVLISEDQMRLKTKKAFFNRVANTAQLEFEKDRTLWNFCFEILRAGYTPIFEFQHPAHRIVIPTDKPVFTLLAIRHMKTGTYLLLNEMSFGNINVVPEFDLSYNDLVEEAKTLTDFEGWVITWPHDGQRVKIKTNWYHMMHRLTTNIRTRDVADAVIDETFDDLVSQAKELNINPGELHEIAQRVIDQFTNLQNSVTMIVQECHNKRLSPLDVAAKYDSHPLFKPIMYEFRGKDFDYKKFWRKNYRKEYDLDCVYNKTFSD